MAESLRFDGRVAIVTGAGHGLGRAHAMLLAERGAAVVVNDLGGGIHGEGASDAPAQQVVDAIKAAGGEAVANFDSVEDGERIVQSALDSYKRVDIVVNNAGILRDVSFHKMTDEDWDLIYRVHVLGTYKVTRAAWPHLRDQEYGRVVMTASASGIYGNFGQANYSMAKLGITGLANTLAHEGHTKNIHVNTIAPVAGSRLTETVMPKELVDALKPEYVSPLVAWLCHEDCAESGGLFEVGAGWFGKLRWQRSQGASVSLAGGVTIEDVRDRWGAITDFTEADYPTNNQEALTAVIKNLESAKAPQAATAVNENIQPEKVLGHKFEPGTLTYTERDLSLYALGIGMSQNPLDENELPFVYELSGDGFKSFPTFAVTFPFDVLKALSAMEGLKFNPMMLLHGEQRLELPRPLPKRATVTTRARIGKLYDKGKGAVLVIESESEDESGTLLSKNENTIFIRGLGGFGGERGPAGKRNVAPNRPPDAVEEEKTSENQALVYRLSGDPNPLHADPGMAAGGGFDRPILHGLCTLGFAARHVLKRYADYDATRFKSIDARFTRHVFPGETVITEMWDEGGTIVFQCRVKERDEVVISNAAITLRAAEAPVKPAPSTAESGGVHPEVTTIFDEITRRIEEKPEIAGKINAVYQFDVTGEGGGTWTVDLKGGNGVVSTGPADQPNCTITMTVDDFIALMTGRLDGQTAFLQGKLKVRGEVMLATRLTMLR